MVDTKEDVQYAGWGKFINDNFKFEDFRPYCTKQNLKFLGYTRVGDFTLELQLYLAQDYIQNGDGMRSILFMKSKVFVLDKYIAKIQQEDNTIKEAKMFNNVIVPVTFSANSDPPILQDFMRLFYKNGSETAIQEVGKYRKQYLEVVKPSLPHYDLF